MIQRENMIYPASKIFGEDSPMMIHSYIEISNIKLLLDVKNKALSTQLDGIMTLM